MTTLSDKTLVSRKKNIMVKRLNDTLYGFDASSGLLYTFNSTAQAIWKRLSKPRTVKELAEHLAHKYGIGYNEAAHDVKTFISSVKDGPFELR